MTFADHFVEPFGEPFNDTSLIAIQDCTPTKQSDIFGAVSNASSRPSGSHLHVFKKDLRTDQAEFQKSSKTKEPEPLPIFSCIYCVREFLVFTNLSNRMLAKKYLSPFLVPLTLNHSKTLTGYPETLAPLHCTADNLSFGYGNDKELVPPKRLFTEDHPSLGELQLLCSFDAMSSEHPTPRNYVKDTLKAKLEELVKAKYQSVYMPQLKENEAELRWLIHKIYIGKKDKVFKGIATFYDKSLSSNTNLRSSILRTQQQQLQNSVKKSGIDNQCINLENDSEFQPLSCTKQNLEISYSSDSEHDIYSPNFDSDYSDESFIDSALKASRALKLTEPTYAQLNDFLACETDATNSVQEIGKSEKYTIIRAKLNISKKSAVTSIDRSNVSQTSSNILSPYVLSSRQYTTPDTELFDDGKLINDSTHLRHESSSATPNVTLQNTSANNVIFPLGLTQSISLSSGKSGFMTKCISAQQLLKTRNAAGVPEFKTGHLKNPAVKNVRPKPLVTSRIKQARPVQKRLVHYGPVFPKKMSGVQFPLFGTNGVGCKSARHTDPSSYAVTIMPKPVTGVKTTLSPVLQQPQLARSVVSPAVKKKPIKSPFSPGIRPGTTAAYNTTSHRRLFTKCATNYKPIKLDFVWSHKYFQGVQPATHRASTILSKK
eukprot:TRINITY_DN87991_c1_g1_i1.p1 TRINITY_DN87991_c1_g1~~TRINITY_DN87991_c1_g1_i1.p1  ORF type:complete len:657 (+),score=26.99 TRINITY_DN87991_c1_g1_i1:219-2189(+)